MDENESEHGVFSPQACLLFLVDTTQVTFGVVFGVKDRYKWRIGSGEAIPFWDQNWLVDGNAIDKPADLPE